MFTNAIEEAAQFTRPIHTITRSYNDTIVTPGAATLFFVNEMGVAITCRHVVDLIGQRDAINRHYENFKKEKETIGKNNNYNKRLKELELKYNLKPENIVQVKDMFIGCTSDQSFSYHPINHPKYDLSILVFENFKNPSYQSHAYFTKDTNTLRQGKSLCRLGFPFPEFTNFRYNKEADDIEWTNTGRMESPRFPIDGMLTRHLLDDGKIVGLEISTPGLRGQSGGPLFDVNGTVAGMQSSTHHLHLGFDMKNLEYNINGKSIRINNQPFLHVGHCIHADVIKSFLRENNIKFYER